MLLLKRTLLSLIATLLACEAHLLTWKSTLMTWQSSLLTRKWLATRLAQVSGLLPLLTLLPSLLDSGKARLSLLELLRGTILLLLLLLLALRVLRTAGKLLLLLLILLVCRLLGELIPSCLRIPALNPL